LDIDDFKKINDVYGHNVGDNVLKKFSSEMEKTVRDCDLLARWGGDEFAIILHNSTMKETKKVIERLQFRLQKPLDNLHINVSIGYTLFDPQNPLTSNELIQNADKSLYEIKRFRKNNNLTKKVNRKLELVENI
jgi:diguanylate cyclase (GGDEF)-like protein